MIHREDGPVKHYRMQCDKCGKQTKRFAYDFDFQSDAPLGWKEVQEDEPENLHYCPKCASGVREGVKEVVANVGDSIDLSDHEEVPRPLVRRASNTLVIDLQDGCTVVITSDAPIKVEQHDK